jgi:hypothetical protein
MQNRIRHLLNDWKPKLAKPEATGKPEPRAGGHGLPRGINMLMPVELCINRDLLISLLSASIREIHRHKRALPEDYSARELAEVEAALLQQMEFRSWARSQPASYINIAMYPVTEIDAMEDLEEDLGEF